MEVTAEKVATAVSNVAAARGKGTLPNVMAFARALKELGVKVSLSQVLDASRSVELVDIAARADFRALLRANMISQKEDFPAFDMLFDCFWREQGYERVPMETTTPLNPLGVKGIGEAGTIGATPAVQNAVIDALAHLGVVHADMPLTPERVWSAIATAASRA